MKITDSTCPRVRAGAATLLLAAMLATPIEVKSAARDSGLLPRTEITQALRAMGEARDPHALHGLQADVRSVSFHLIDGDHPDAPYLVDFAEGVVTDDFKVGASLAESRNETATGARIEGQVLTTSKVVQSVTIYDGETRPPRGSPPAPNWDLANPVRALLIAERAPDLRREANVQTHGVVTHVLAFAHGGAEAKIYLNAETHLPVAIETRFSLPGDIAWRARGDLLDRTEYANWTLVSGLRYPFQWDTTRNGAPLRTTVISGLRLDPGFDAGKFEVLPAALADLNTPGREDVDETPLGRSDRAITEIAPGVIQIPGSWYVTLVKQTDGIVIIDAPISNGYSEKVLAEAARRFPGVPIKAVISTTSFGWHFAGLREYVARGVPVYILDRNAAVAREIVDAPHVLSPDRLAEHPVRPQLRLVSGPTRIGTGKTALVLYPVRRATAQMMMVYIPAAKLLHTAEMIQPLGPGDSMLFPESLLEVAQSVEDDQLDVTTVIGMHMSPTPWASVEDAIRRAG